MPAIRRPIRYDLTATNSTTERETPLHVRIMRAVIAALPSEALVLHYPAGGGRDAKSRQLMKILGLRSGFPDLMILLFGRIWTLEVKTAEGVESPQQIAMAILLRAARVPRRVVRSEAEAIAALRRWGLPVRRNPAIEPRLPPNPQPTSEQAALLAEVHYGLAIALKGFTSLARPSKTDARILNTESLTAGNGFAQLAWLATEQEERTCGPRTSRP